MTGEPAKAGPPASDGRSARRPAWTGFDWFVLAGALTNVLVIAYLLFYWLMFG